MKSKANFTKEDLVVVLGCFVFLLVNLGAIGSSGRRRAKEAVCLCNLKQWGVIWKSYTDDHGGFFPGRGGSDPPEGMIGWMFISEPYYKNHKILLCPEAVKSYSYGGKPPFASWTDQTGEYTGSYCVNLWVANGRDDDPPTSYFNVHCWRTPYTKSAAYVPLLLDGNWKDCEAYHNDLPPDYEDYWWQPNQNEMKRVCVNRHNAAVNGVFLDLSARKIGLKELWKIWWQKDWNPNNDPPPDFCTPTATYNGWMCNMKDFP